MNDMAPKIEPCSDYAALTDIWHASVKATHDFLTLGDIDYYRECIPRDYMPNLAIYATRNDSGRWCAFIGIGDDMVEMLFVHPDAMGRGYGSALLRFAIARGIRHVDVNEQNPRALRFYLCHGFRVISRSPIDPQGHPYPILHLSL